MHSLIEILNVRGAQFLRVAWPMLWQSSLLIALLFALDFAARKKARATVRYALWMLVLVKLVLPVSLSLPTSVGYWVPAPKSLAMEEAMAPPVLTDMRYAQPTTPPIASRLPRRVAAVPRTIPLPAVTWPGIIAVSWLCYFVVLSGIFLLRARQARRIAARAVATDDFSELLAACARKIGVRSRVSLKLSDAVDTPAVCGLFRPVVLLPAALVGKLDKPQLQAVLLHELAHVRRGDLWVGHWQTALQIFYFYNPLLWLANAAIRRVREEAVDELVLVAMAEEAAVYPETLLHVAKFSLQAPRLAFGFAGILEKRSTLGARIRLMLQRPWPTSAKLGVPGAVALLVLGLILLPMSNSRRLNPSYQAPQDAQPKTAEQWWGQMNNNMDLTDKQFQEGIDAFMHMGDRAVPFLRNQLAKGKSDDLAGPGGRRHGVSPGVRSQSKAAWILYEMGPAAANAVPDLIAVLKQGDHSAMYAAMALGSIGPKARAAIPTLFDALQSGQDCAGEALTQIDPENPKLVSALTDALEKYSGPLLSDHSRLITRTETALGKLGPRAAGAVPVLREMLKYTNGPIENDCGYGAARALKIIAANQSEVVAEADAVLHHFLPVVDISEVIADVDHARGTDGYAGVFQKLCTDINHADVSGTPIPATIIKQRIVPLFSEALDSTDQEVVDTAIQSLGELGQVAAPVLPKVIKILENDDPARVFFGNEINALGVIAPGDPTTLPPLLRLLNDTNTTLQLHENICWAFTHFGPEAAAAVPGLHKYLNNYETWTKFNTALALWRIAKEPPSVAILQEALHKMEGDYTSLGVLEMLGGLNAQTDETKSIIRQLARSTNDKVRTNAMALLEKIGEKKNAL